MKTVELPLVEDTEEFGRKLGELVRAGDLLLLAGPLGAGKTAFVRGLARGMGVQGRVSSPTFVVARVHEPAEGRSVRLVHVDAYRLGGHLDELDDLDLDTDLVDAVVAVEWGEGVAERLNDDHLLIRLERGTDDVRTAQLIPQGEWVDRPLPV
ncbi:tRNA (adenosine(37)-N6)-threonylcarbamoyltransferase complex ATPase subunit type 1 TsaE [Lentzea sp. NBRC 102530]|uniref:tRNA (adenosine(37)-N6)-threonylcarbamoyltransferase complex ATPase subunit type 1 TsaE n=1 Tax=Lentzea sp. NBRC 102530 TaxID=3032201 RepID=UPI0024A0AF13|nr:tRNA (adenosine(37)-N6)-threonylcarbamoyltransferase complex ATPase subunit type 1 TsaE [Lentzea sp. NBRC 102530]GLY52291.1 tRNA (adenosine(37)-N6)-threonylcarbamoyltransferase complex ATPase subunit type 1 TsaE [Lentzea sp. NBRC 102530]